MTHILMIAAENGALPGGKVGGIGDVVRDVPLALEKRDCHVSVITPGYGKFSKLPGAKLKQSLTVNFAGQQQSLEIYHLSKIGAKPKIRHYAIEHPMFSRCGVGKIYCDDPPGRPFSSDASKFALFCCAVAEAISINTFGKLDTLHLHDWHAAFLLILRQYMPRYQALQSLHCAFSIHNLALQGIRPFKDDESSLQEWFSDLQYEPRMLADPRWSDCVNPMASAIRLADTVHAVSPSYAREILKPTDDNIGRHGGEGLEKDLIQANREKRLFGILNGCEYSDNQQPGEGDWPYLLNLMQNQITQWISRSANLSSAHFIAFNTLNKLDANRPEMLITSVGRITQQKIELMHQPTSSGKPALHEILEPLRDRAMLIVLGSGDAIYEQFLCETAAIYPHFIFLRGYSEDVGDALYQQGDLFFMPSSFEPCGISQMIAMRAGQPCLVHKVGGLRDTVINNKTGYVFSGKSLTEQADAMLSTMLRAVKSHQKNPQKWRNMRSAVAAARFEWDDSINAYLEQLYKVP